MRIYLLRHAIAEKRNIRKFPNDDRPLTKEGYAKMQLISKGVAKLSKKFDKVYCSPLKRSYQTAEILNQSVRFSKKMIISKDLLPDAEVKTFIQSIKKLRGKSSILLVGHQPYLSKFANALTGLNIASADLKKGSLTLIMLEPQKSPLIKFLLPPNLLIKLGQSD